MNAVQTKGRTRNTIDKYYTKDSTASLCITLIKQYIVSSSTDLVIEPSAGNGAFIEGAKTLSDNYIFYDLEPEHPEITQQDYLTLKCSEFGEKFGKVHVLGNPPFGRQSSLAIKFIKKSAGFCDSISFILPRSFKKDSLRKAFPANFHLLHEIELPDKSFLVDGAEHTVPCVFQIWEKRIYQRTPRDLLTPIYFMFVGKSDNPDISVRRVGGNAGLVDLFIGEQSVQSHYFIKFTNNKSIIENAERIKHATYDVNNTVGPKSISKQELIFKFNALLVDR